MEQNHLLKIGAVAKLAKVNIQTIRYYERRGLLKAKQKTEAGYRFFSRDAVDTISFIKQAQDLGFSLSDIIHLLDFRKPHSPNCQAVQEEAIAKLSEIHQKIKRLKQMAHTMETLILNCQGRAVADSCPILDGLEATHET